MNAAPDPSRLAVRFEWQRALFAEKPSRRALLQLASSWTGQSLVVRVHRNHSFELVASVAVQYLSFAGFDVEFLYSDYDDSLQFHLEDRADLELVWLDLSRYGEDLDLSAWLTGRLKELRQRASAPLLVVPLDGETPVSIEEAPGLHVASLAPLEEAMGAGFLDLRRVEHTGTRISGNGCVAVARTLGSHWIPAIFRTPIKALVLDLDNTLYRGVLGEDGPEGVELTDGHSDLQEALRALHGQGVFLCLASRNEEADVRRLFEMRSDFPLSWDDFSHRGIHWGGKGDTVQAAAEALRIGTDAMLLMDDNPGELMSAVRSVPDLQVLLAGPAGDDSLRALNDFPGLFKWRHTDEDALRAGDLAASAERHRSMAELTGAGAEDYLASLGMELTFHVDDGAQLARAAELCGKTNQFNLSLARSGERELEPFLTESDRSLITVGLSDRLSDSGVIAVLAGRREQDRLVLDELCVSCRALGRGMETTLIAAACHEMASRLGTEGVAFCFREGPRNGPARTWLEGLPGIAWSSGGERAQCAELPPFKAGGIALHGLSGRGLEQADSRP